MIFHIRFIRLLITTLFFAYDGFGQHSINDGPYVFYEGGQLSSYSIIEGRPIKANFPENRMTVTLKVRTDIIGRTFEVRLKPGLGYELSNYEMPNELIAISDIEGNFDSFRKLLQSTEVIDEKLNWCFGKGHLVLVGDFVDRGDMVTEVLWLIYKLEWEAYEAGGHVHFILGNHEMMNLNGNFRYTHPKYKQSAKLIGKELVELYSDHTELGQWLRTKNVIEKIGNNLFVHAGISQKVNELNLPIHDISYRIHSYYNRDTQLVWDSQLANGQHEVLVSGLGPLWYRGYYNEKEPGFNVIDSTLKQYQVFKIITGHTVVADTISTWHQGKVINIDTKHSDGNGEALLIENNNYYRINSNGERFRLFSYQLGADF